MAAPTPPFPYWLERAQQTPERVVDQFLARYRMIPPETQRAWLASHPDRNTLLQSLQQSSANEDAALHGIPYVMQDLIDVKGMPTSCGAPFSEPFEGPVEESGLLAQTLESLGACCFAKTVPAEFGYDISGKNPSYGACPHGDGLRWVCGGGAGASIRSVYEGLVPLAFGLDSCGGMRLPTALHGLFGFRMAPNDLARNGAYPIVPTLESVACCTANIEDLLQTFNALYQLPEEPEIESLRGYVYHGPSIAGSHMVKRGVMQLARELMVDDDPALATELGAAFQQAAQAMTWIEARELYSVHRYWLDEYRNDYAPELLQLIERGTDCTAAEFEASHEAQDRIRTAFAEFFERYDVLIMPICPVPNPEKKQWNEELQRSIRELIAPVSLARLPALILPINCGPGRHAAVQIAINPRKLAIVPALLAQVTGYYID